MKRDVLKRLISNGVRLRRYHGTSYEAEYGARTWAMIVRLVDGEAYLGILFEDDFIDMKKEAVC